MSFNDKCILSFIIFNLFILPLAIYLYYKKWGKK